MIKFRTPAQWLIVLALIAFPTVSQADTVSNAITHLEHLTGTSVSEPSPSSMAAQLHFGSELAAHYQKSHPEFTHLINQASRILEKATPDNYSSAVHQAYDILQPMEPAAKSYTLYLIGHAHIDMDWLWPWSETVQACHDTFASALHFMQEFPQFHFSQSQVSAYVAMQDHHPSIFAGIRNAVKRGQWEVTAGMWDESDSNMASGEALFRTALYSTRYTEKELGVRSRIVWLPDNFGHAWTLPDIMSRCGFKYFYFCRCRPGPLVFNWEGPGGGKLLAVLNTGWYNETIDNGIADRVFQMQDEDGVKAGLVVYGVGDHGGGPTLQDIQRATDMQKRPIWPRIVFTSAQHADAKIAAEMAKLHRKPVTVDKELNFTFQGCYTTHADIKHMNRVMEYTLPDCETISVLNSLLNGHPYPNKVYEDAWRATCFNQFHDILCGSAIHSSYAYSIGLAEAGLQNSESARGTAMQDIAGQVNTTAFHKPLLVFNSMTWPRRDILKLPVDFPSNVIADNEGRLYPVQNTSDGERLAVVPLPATGYSTFDLKPAVRRLVSSKPGVTIHNWVMENAYLRVRIDPQTGTIVSLYDKALHRELVPSGQNFGVLQALHEGPNGMSAWDIGPILGTTPLIKPLSVKVLERGPVRVMVAATYHYDVSDFTQRISLVAGEPRVYFRTNVNWQERGNGQYGGTMLKVAFPMAIRNPRATYEIPFGSIQRPTDGSEVPSQKWMDLSEYPHPLITPPTRQLELNLSSLFTANGITTRSNPTAGSFDVMNAPGFSFPRSEMPPPGSQVHYNGIEWKFPNYAKETNNYLACAGQTIKVNNAPGTTVHLLGAGVMGSQSGEFILRYSDGSTSTAFADFGDWVVGGGNDQPVITTDHRNVGGGIDNNRAHIGTITLFGVPGKRLAAIQLPYSPNIHLVAITVSNSVHNPKAGQAAFGIAILNRDKYGCDTKNNVMRLTLLRSPYNPDPAPDVGHQVIRYAAQPHAGSWKDAGIVRAAYDYDTPVSTIETTAHRGRMPAAFSWLNVSAPNVVISAIKKSEVGNDLIVRLYETAGRPAHVRLNIGFPVVWAKECNGLERPLKDGRRIVTTAHSLLFTVKPHDIVTLRIGIRGGFTSAKLNAIAMR